MDGNENIHSGTSHWYDKCLRCNKSQSEEKWENSAAGRELGFNNSKPKSKKGVKSCSSFTWAIEPVKLNNIRFIKNEYGDKIIKSDFTQILTECPVMFFDQIGEEFS